MSCTGILAQHENDTWVFGQNKWILNPSGFTNSQFGYYNKYVTASISDKDTGQLLFYSNGISVQDKNGNLMSNGNHLLGEPSSDPTLAAFYDAAAFCGGNMTKEGVMILPKPGTTNHYYIFSQINTNYIDCLYNGRHYREYGLRYAEVDMSTSLGNVISKNNIIQTMPTVGLTSALSSDNSFFWLVTIKNGNFYAYKVTSNGVQLGNPVISNGPGINNAGALKISPNGEYIISYRNGNSNENYILYSFNNSTGQISNPIDIFSTVPSFHYYGDQSAANLNTLEFSPDSNIIYFISSLVLSTNEYAIGASGLCMYNINTGELFGANSNSTAYDFLLLNDSAYVANIQRANNGKIYLIFNEQYESPYNHNNIEVVFGYEDYPPPHTYHSFDWGVINNPNIWDTSNNPISYINAPIGVKNGYVFPQLIPELPTCVSDLIITENVLSGESDMKSALNTITATNVVFSGGSAEYDAGVTVFLKPGFNAKSGSDFRGFIQGCTVPPTTIKTEENLDRKENKPISETEKVLILQPNPTTGIINFLSKDNMYSWELSNAFGNIKLSGYFKIDNSKSLEIDLSNLITGVYYVKVVFQDSEIITKTIVKE